MILLHRFGSFLFIIGLVLLLYFFASDQSENPQFLLFFTGMLATALGIFIGFRYRPAPGASDRFSLLRKLGERLSKKKK
jgi:uncharacterized membrane protein HdeD (DUF308 family)